MTATRVEAHDAIRKRITDVVTAGATAIVGHVPDMRYARVRKPTDQPPDPSKHWLRISCNDVDAPQTAFVGESPGPTAKQFTTFGVTIIELYAPMSQVDGARRQDMLAQLIQNALRNYETANGVWFRRPTIKSVQDDEKAYRLNVTVEHEYDTLAA
jgi:hypothetical protein